MGCCCTDVTVLQHGFMILTFTESCVWHLCLHFLETDVFVDVYSLSEMNVDVILKVLLSCGLVHKVRFLTVERLFVFCWLMNTISLTVCISLLFIFPNVNYTEIVCSGVERVTVDTVCPGLGPIIGVQRQGTFFDRRWMQVSAKSRKLRSLILCQS